MTEAVPLGELLHEEALFGLTGVRKVGVPRGRLFPSGLCLSAISASSLGVARPFTNKVEKGRKKCTDPMVGRARSIINEITVSSSSDHLFIADSDLTSRFGGAESFATSISLLSLRLAHILAASQPYFVGILIIGNNIKGGSKSCSLQSALFSSYKAL